MGLRKRIAKRARAAKSSGTIALGACLSPLRSIGVSLLESLKRLRVDVWRISAGVRKSEKLSIIFAGRERSKNYIAELIFGDDYDEEKIARRWNWNTAAAKGGNPLDDTLLVFESPSGAGRHGRDGFFLPCWIEGTLSLSALNTFQHRDDLRRIKKYGLQYEICNRRSRYDMFYHEMYLPYLGTVYGNKAFPIPYKTLMARIRKCDLILITRRDQYISGGVILYGRQPKIWSIGVQHGDRANLRCGAVGAVWAYSLEYLRDRGYTDVHFGESRPFLQNGVLKNKKARGVSVTGCTRKGFFISGDPQSGAVADFYLNNPFIHLVGRKLHAAVFVDGKDLSSGADAERLYKIYFQKGLSRLDIYVMEGEEGLFKDIVPEWLRQRVAVYRFEGKTRGRESAGSPNPRGNRESRVE